MPFKSIAQYHYMSKNMPKTAKKWMAETKDITKLPQRKKKKK